jgi:hypothetical protein
MRVLIGALLLLGVQYAHVSAQGREVKDCGIAGGGLVRGRLIPEGNPYLGASRGIELVPIEGQPCLGVSGDDGPFLFMNVGPGRDSFEIGTLGVAPPDSMVIEVLPGETVELEVLLGLEDAIAACVNSDPACRNVMGVSPPESFTAAQREEFQFWRAALALAGIGRPALEGVVLCLNPLPSEPMLESLRPAGSEVVPTAECSLRGVMTHLPSGRRAVSIGYALREADGQTVLDLSYSRAGLDARGYRCELTAGSGGREIGRSWTTFIS